jgi:hypothetical protein
MKINKLTAFLSCILASLISFFFSYYVSGDNKIILALGSLLSLTGTLMGSMSISFEYGRTTILIRIISLIFFLAILISQIFFTLYSSFNFPIYILVTGGLFIIYFFAAYSISIFKI